MVVRFPDETSPIEFLEAVRWPSGPSCSRCGCVDVSRVTSVLQRKDVIRRPEQCQAATFEALDGLHSNMRARLGVAKINDVPTFAQGTRVRSIAFVHNSGNSEARNPSLRSVSVLIPSGVLLDPGSRLVGATKLPMGDVPPKANYQLSALWPGEDRSITSEESEAVRVGRSRFYLIGKIEYEDAYRDRHSTEFCYVLSVIKNLPNGFSACGQYSKAD